ncbi:MAG: hypothetical protein NZO16_02205 [Deltaproteobacteria bacterium]|nr:hypothetical protein [Deltaproteobacteria bacterium]
MKRISLILLGFGFILFLNELPANTLGKCRTRLQKIQKLSTKDRKLENRKLEVKACRFLLRLIVENEALRLSNNSLNEHITTQSTQLGQCREQFSSCQQQKNELETSLTTGDLDRNGCVDDGDFLRILFNMGVGC